MLRATVFVIRLPVSPPKGASLLRELILWLAQDTIAFTPYLCVLIE